MGPAAYVLKEVLQACAKSGECAEDKVPAKKWPARVVGKAREEAAKELGLLTEKEALIFLGQQAESDFEVENLAAELEKNPFNVKVLVDSYRFKCASKVGYLAFYKNPDSGVWIIKSLKKNSASALTFNPFANIQVLLTGKVDENDE